MRLLALSGQRSAALAQYVGKLATAGRDRHSDFYCDFLQQHSANWYNAHQSEALTEVTQEAGNVQSAWHWALQQEAWLRLYEALDSWGWYHTWQGLDADKELYQ